MNWTAVPVVPGMREGSTRQSVAAERSSVARVQTHSDAAFSGMAHLHPHEQWLVVLHGTVRLRVGEEEVVARQGDLVFFPPQTLHAALGVGEEGCEYLEIFSPARLDQLPGSLLPDPLQYE